MEGTVFLQQVRDTLTAVLVVSTLLSSSPKLTSVLAQSTPGLNVTLLLQDKPQYSTLLALFQQNNIDAQIESYGHELTLLAPDNDAFAAIDPAINASIYRRNEMSYVLRYHILLGGHDFAEFQNSGEGGESINSVAGPIIHLKYAQNAVWIGNDTSCAITAPDMVTDTLMVQGINNVLIPAELQ